MIGEAPKLKGTGKIVARSSTSAPTKRASDYDVAWVTGLTFRNSTQTMALCITPKGKDPASSGLHLTADAARELVTQLKFEASRARGSVAVNNHSGGVEKLWQRFSDADAVVLADRIAGSTP